VELAVAVLLAAGLSSRLIPFDVVPGKNPVNRSSFPY
jgi:hypothetical protein